MSDYAQLVLWLIPGAPLLAAICIALVGKLALGERSHVPCVAALALAFGCSLFLLTQLVPPTFEQGGHGEEHHVAHPSENLIPGSHLVFLENEARSLEHQETDSTAGHGDDNAHAHADGQHSVTDASHAPPASTQETGVVAVGYQWLDIGTMQMRLDLRADAITAIMLAMVTGVSLLVAIFASGYMHHDPGYPRFFGAVSLFVFSMCMLVLAGNYLQLFVFWEAVGLCSYLLIGFWFKKPSAAAAAKKAFVVNRIGDFGLILGIFLIWTTFGSVNFADVLFNAEALKQVDPARIQLICLLLFVGAMGKSAQFPLHVWLPDAMEGPTPVSALIHAATMVTAGVYLVARSTPLFVLAPTAQLVVAGVGAATALIAALTALTQYDLKRVMAYSTVSQLGFMFMALGAAAAGPDQATFAVTAAMFHLFTHAYFKALLFLASGSVMHSMGDVIDMRRFSGLRKALPITHWTFLCGALALAGFPMTAGFWSKDEILAALDAGARSQYARFFDVIYATAVVTALLTAFYTFRAYFMTFWGPEKFPEEAGHHPHEAPPVMAWPLRILAIFALGIGFAAPWFADYLHHTPGLPASHPHEMSLGLMLLSAVIAVSGISVAYVWYIQSPSIPASLAKSLSPLFALSQGKFFLDELFTWILVLPLRLMATACILFDKYVIDPLVDAFGLIPNLLSEAPRRLHGGLTTVYATTMLLAVIGCVVCVMQLFAAG